MLFSKDVLSNLFYTLVMLLCVSACSNQVSYDKSQTTLSHDLVIDSASIPLLDDHTTTGVYIRNYSGHEINGLNYVFSNVESELTITLINSCESIAANSECLLEFKLSGDNSSHDSGSFLISALYDNKHKISQQLINYAFIDKANYTNNQFYNDRFTLLDSTKNVLQGSTQTIYLILTEISQSLALDYDIDHIKLNYDNNKFAALKNAKLPAILPIGVSIANHGNGSYVGNISYVVNAKVVNSLTESSQSSSSVVSVSVKREDRAHILISKIATFGTLNNKISQVVTLFNNGNVMASDLANSIESNSSEFSIVTTGVDNPCQATLSVGDSCNIMVTLNQTAENGAADLITSYASDNNGAVKSHSKNTALYYVNDKGLAMIEITPNNSSVTLERITSSTVTFSVKNASGVPFNITNIKLNIPEDNAIVSESMISNSCSNVYNNYLTRNASCLISYNLTSGSSTGIAKLYLSISGVTDNQQSTKFNSFFMTTTVLPSLVSYSPVSDAERNPLITLNFSTAVKNVNTTTVSLRQNSPDGPIVSISNPLSTDNKTYTFTPESLSINTVYYITLSSGITDMNNIALSAKSVTFKTRLSELSLINGAGISTNAAYWQSLAISSTNVPYVAYTDDVSGKANVKMFNGTNWSSVGGENFSSGLALNLNLAILSNGTLYLAFRDGTNINGVTNRATVMMYNGTSWVNVGNAGFSAGPSSMHNLAINPVNQRPYVIYNDSANSNRATVMMYNGSSWVNVGSAGFSASGVVFFPNLAISSTGTIFASYREGGAIGGVTDRTVMRTWNGSSWSAVSEVSTGQSGVSSLAINPVNQRPYVAYEDSTQGGKATVRMFNGTSWVNVGSPGFSASAVVGALKLVIANDGTIYITYGYGSPRNTAVMKFDSATSSWVNVGTPGFTGSPSNFQTMALDNNGVPYIAYSDGTNGNKTSVRRFMKW